MDERESIGCTFDLEYSALAEEEDDLFDFISAEFSGKNDADDSSISFSDHASLADASLSEEISVATFNSSNLKERRLPSTAFHLSNTASRKTTKRSVSKHNTKVISANKSRVDNLATVSTRRRPSRPLGKKAALRAQAIEAAAIATAAARASIPPIVHSDIRRQYASMFANMFNAFDGALISDFMSQFCMPHTSMVNKCAHACSLGLPQRLELPHVQHIFEFWYGRMICFPDTVFSLDDVRIRQRSDWNGCSQVVAAIKVTGTQLYKLNITNWLPTLCMESATAQKNSNQMGTHTADNTSGSINGFNHLESNFTSTLKLEQNPPSSQQAVPTEVLPCALSPTAVIKTSIGQVQTTDMSSIVSNSAAKAGVNITNTDSRSASGSSSACLISLSERAPAAEIMTRTEAATAVVSPAESGNVKNERQLTVNEEVAKGKPGLSLLDLAMVVECPQRMAMTGTMTMYLDAHKRIQRFEFNSEPIPA